MHFIFYLFNPLIFYKYQDFTTVNFSFSEYLKNERHFKLVTKLPTLVSYALAAMQQQ